MRSGRLRNGALTRLGRKLCFVHGNPGRRAMDDLIYLLLGLAAVGVFALYAVALRRI